MSRPGIQSHPGKVKATHRYDVVDLVGRPSVVGKRFHFIGAGGVGMSGLARMLLEKKAVVTGSDQSASAATSRLRRMVYKYAQFLGELLSHFEGIAVSGTHGKSTTSGWLAYCLKRAGVDVNFVVGADIPQLGASSGSGRSEFFVAEACEYDRSFQNFKSSLACILNIECDHLDCYKDEADIVEAFYQFARGSKPEGLIVANGDDPNVRAVLERLGSERACLTFGLDADRNFCARNVRQHLGLYRFDVFRDGLLLGPARISLPGRHNIRNALAVVAMAVSIGIESERILEVLDGFTGVDRRLMLKGQFRGITVLDDYAHHPTEIRASLEAIRQRYKPQRLWCVYQAHQYSRTRFFLDEFAASFAQADKAIIPEIYFVRDSEASRKQVVVTMGAGDVWKVADEFIQRLRSDY